ncbi:beta-lactamase family protein [Maritalea mobilis]|uniref:Beta-lactamase family protein n=1 Tax=Maritalea mobilis TaxID=483324 RepID=A0A4R6VGJ2_9HYPH|nr:MBL fold metallo-hydrolase [Maritalea mobilis]TDQ60467.1 beta-lactamase family protein [Maritalea mobilis]
MAKIEILSGLGAKGPACIRLHINDEIWLLDCGHGPEDHTPFDPNWLEGAAKVFISHDHIDHIGGAGHVIASNIPIYCTATTAKALPEGAKLHLLPERGETIIDGVKLTTGRNGHALGGVWFHFALGDGLFYSGDWSEESNWFAFDVPPKAELALLDASYHLNNVPQAMHRQNMVALIAQLDGQMLFPVPPSGRAAELALFLSQFGEVSLDQTCQAAVNQALAMGELDGLCAEGQLKAERLLHPFNSDARFLICDNPNADGGLAWELTQKYAAANRLGVDVHLIFTGHMTVHARNLKAQYQGHFCRWNVHPPLQDQVKMLNRLDAKYYAPLFCDGPEAYNERPEISAQMIGTERISL